VVGWGAVVLFAHLFHGVIANVNSLQRVVLCVCVFKQWYMLFRIPVSISGLRGVGKAKWISKSTHYTLWRCDCLRTGR
jgi:hypothetical protein